MYSKIRLCVKETYRLMTPYENVNNSSDASGDDSSDFMFTSFSGVFQGECLSPFLFSLYINDLCDY